MSLFANQHPDPGKKNSPMDTSNLKTQLKRVESLNKAFVNLTQAVQYVYFVAQCNRNVTEI